MKRSHWVLALTSALVTLMAAPVASADPPGKTEVCHRTAADTSEVPTWRLITVSVKSLDKHIEHGDGEPLGEVPGTDGEFFFDETCGVVSTGSGDPGDAGDPPDVETVFAIAYSDLDQSGKYESGIDILISKLVDGPGSASDGLPGAGDIVVTDQYPMQLGLGSFGGFGVTEHTVTGVSSTATRCMASASTGTFIWDSSSSLENYEERASGGGGLSVFKDSSSSGGSDVVMAVTGSPSQPLTAASAGVFDDTDDPFVEVELACST